MTYVTAAPHGARRRARPATATASSSRASMTSASRTASSRAGATAARRSTWSAATVASSRAAASSIPTGGATGPQCKGGTSEVAIRRCVFEGPIARGVEHRRQHRPAVLPSGAAGRRGQGHHGRGQRLRRALRAGGLRRLRRRDRALQHDLLSGQVGAAHPAGDARGGLRALPQRRLQRQHRGLPAPTSGPRAG